MSFSPPKGISPPQFEGKRYGRPKGSRNWSKAWKDCLWGFEHRNDPDAQPPTAGAALWQAFTRVHYWEVELWLQSHGILPRRR
jgi:hypothetical protein